MKISPKTGMALIFFYIITAFIAGCTDKPDVFTIGIVTQIPQEFHAYEGFQSGMAELGYVEGKNLKSIYRQIERSEEQVIGDEIRRVLDLNVDLLLTFENEVTLKAKEVVSGTDMPVIFVANFQPVELGLVDSLSHPGGNLTGVRIADTTPKALESLVSIVPDARKIFIPYYPKDDLSLIHVQSLDRVADSLGVELVFHDVRSVEAAIAAVQHLPDDVDAIFRIHCPVLNEGGDQFFRAAINRRIPVGAALVSPGDSLMVFTSCFRGAGKQAARLAHQINMGMKPKDLPVEVAEVHLTVNLKVAEMIGIDIPEDILVQAETIIR